MGLANKIAYKFATTMLTTFEQSKDWRRQNIVLLQGQGWQRPISLMLFDKIEYSLMTS